MTAMPAEASDLSPRAKDVQIKHERIAEFLEQEKLEAVLLSRTDNFAWFTSGGAGYVSLAAEAGIATLLVTRDERIVLTNNIEAGRLEAEELTGLGFRVQSVPWYEDLSEAIRAAVGGRPAASDTGLLGTPNAMEALRRLRLKLTDLERQRYQELGRDCSECVERTMQKVTPGMTELDIAGGLSHRLWKMGIVPVVLLVAADERIARFRHPLPTSQAVQHTVMVAVVGRRYGLHASLTRLAHFGPLPADLVERHRACVMVDASLIFFSRPGEPCSEVFRRAQRIYEKYNFPDEWKRHHQGGITGYAPREVRVTPDLNLALRHNMALAWNPSITGTKSEDTIIIDDDGYEILTKTIRWPTLRVSVKGYVVRRPDILQL